MIKLESVSENSVFSHKLGRNLNTIIILLLQNYKGNHLEEVNTEEVGPG